MNTPLRRSGMARVFKESHSFTCMPRSSANGTYLPLPSKPKLVLIYRPRRDGRLSWPWVVGWLHTKINFQHHWRIHGGGNMLRSSCPLSVR